MTRRQVEDVVERLIALLDHMDGDSDLEPTLGSISFLPWDSQACWADGVPGDHEREDENEHGDGILDVGHS